MLPYFFSAGHIHYARYISWHLLDMQSIPNDVKKDFLNGAHVCRHNSGSWNAVSSDQFGEQTAIKKGKGGLKGMALSPNQVAVGIDSYPILAYISEIFENTYEENNSLSKTAKYHKEEGKKRITNDNENRQKILQSLLQHSHPLENNNSDLYNIVNGHIAPSSINIQNALSIGESMAHEFFMAMPN